MAIDSRNAPPPAPPAVVGTRSVDIVVSLLLLALAALLGWDSWRTGMSWAADGPQAGYFPFYLSVMMGAASLYGLVRRCSHAPRPIGAFVTRDQFGRVMQVFVPTLAVLHRHAVPRPLRGELPADRRLHVVDRQHRALEVAAHRFLFTAAMFVTFEIAFDVIMPKGPLEAAFGF